MGKFLVRIYNSINIKVGNELKSIEIYLKELNDGLIPQQERQRVGGSCKRIQIDHQCNDICQLFDTIEKNRSSPETVYKSLEEYEKRMSKPVSVHNK